MLGEAISMLVPQVVGFRLHGQLPEGATATDLVLTVTQILRRDRRRREVRRVLRRGPRRAAARRPRDDREHVARVRRDVRVLPGRRRDAALPAPDRAATTSASRSSRRTARRTCSGTTRPSPRRTRRWSSSTSRPSSRPSPGRGGRRTGSRSRAREGSRSSRRCRASASTTATASTRRSPSRSPRATRPPTPTRARSSRRAAQAVAAAPVATVPTWTQGIQCELDGEIVHLDHGAVVIAAITSCTNTSNPSVMVAAGLARQEGRRARARPQAVGQVEPRARLQGRHRLLRAGRA